MSTVKDPLSGSLCTVTRSIRAYLDDPLILEIMLNDDGRIWIDRVGEGMRVTTSGMTPSEADAFLRFVATESGRTLTRERPTLAGTLPHWRARVQGWIPPVARAPTFTLRKPPSVVYSLDDYVTKQVLSERECVALIEAITDRRNILVGGGTGTGKTTFANAILKAIAEHTRDRLYIVEDTPELQCQAPNKVTVLTEPGVYDMRRAVFDALRARPDRIIVGELRDGSALQLLKAWNTGHPGGLATIHANDTAGMLTRMGQLIEEDRKRADPSVIAEAIHVCVHLTLDRTAPPGRRLSGLDRVRGYDRRTKRWLLEPLS